MEAPSKYAGLKACRDRVFSLLKEYISTRTKQISFVPNDDPNQFGFQFENDNFIIVSDFLNSHRNILFKTHHLKYPADITKPKVAEHLKSLDFVSLTNDILVFLEKMVYKNDDSSNLGTISQEIATYFGDRYFYQVEQYLWNDSHEKWAAIREKYPNV